MFALCPPLYSLDFSRKLAADSWTWSFQNLPDILFASSLCVRHRNQYGSDAMVRELEGSQNVFATPLLDTMRKLSAAVSAMQQQGDMAVLRQLLSSVRYVCRIFFSLNAPGLTPVCTYCRSE